VRSLAFCEITGHVDHPNSFLAMFLTAPPCLPANGGIHNCDGSCTEFGYHRCDSVECDLAWDDEGEEAVGFWYIEQRKPVAQ